MSLQNIYGRSAREIVSSCNRNRKVSTLGKVYVGLKPSLLNSPTPWYTTTRPYLTHNTTCSTLLNMTSTYPRLRTCILPSFNPAAVCVLHVCVCACVCVCVCARARARACVCVCVCARVCVCVCMCVCARVCYGEVAASISSLANWCMVLCMYIYICKCT